ncbi:ABC-2 type transport system permease protein [Lentzea xinjiangensis]|uniref:ABC-2 type transport system permease protein n=1 Tax=Lentzea xinjiangensis TaxID=402600 RepID=A0A1H9RSL1_9PSEU|nr:ABC transporter permease [Lentzea xinjiangensis]SER75538.1 ABC-2 type transport system permease protein [Lentzea xinjiangensis]
MNAKVFGVELADELRGIVREPAALFFSIVMPVAFFALFVSLFGKLGSGGLSAGTTMLTTFGAFGVISVVLMNPGIGVAADRERGWLRAKQVSAVPIGVTLSAKVVASLPYAAGVLVAMTATAAITGALDAPVPALLRILGVLLLGALPFALLSLAIGFQVGTGAAAAVLNAVLIPSAVLSGLWMPLEIMPAFFADVARFLPTYHLARLALAQLTGAPALAHALVLLGTTIVAAALAAVSYRHARS